MNQASMPAELVTERGMIYQMASPKHPQFRFEWHPQTRRVYVIRKGVMPEVGTLVSPNIESPEMGRCCVLAYVTGYDEGAAKATGPKLIGR